MKEQRFESLCFFVHKMIRITLQCCIELMIQHEIAVNRVDSAAVTERAGAFNSAAGDLPD